VELKIEVDEKAQKIFAIVDDKECVLNFEFPAAGVIDLVHTYVPTSLRNRSIAAELTQFALDYAAKKGLKVVASCPYCAHYIATHR
jgi:predicted GNAT family acetyltransferase